jgi:hypothetical protein
MVDSDLASGVGRRNHALKITPRYHVAMVVMVPTVHRVQSFFAA